MRTPGPVLDAPSTPRPARPPRLGVLPALAWAVVFAVAHTQGPLFYSNQNQYLLHGLAAGGHGHLDGDWLAVHKQVTAQTGQVVVARLGDEVTVKRLKLRGSRAELIAENPDYKPIVVDLKREPLAIEGIAVGVIRPSL